VPRQKVQKGKPFLLSAYPLSNFVDLLLQLTVLSEEVRCEVFLQIGNEKNRMELIK